MASPIGRPSTYASIVGTIQNRGYVYKKGTALVPAWIAFSVIRLMEQHFGRLIEYGFTAELEGVLDDVAGGREDRVAVLTGFWTGEGEGNTVPQPLSKRRARRAALKNLVVEARYFNSGRGKFGVDRTRTSEHPHFLSRLRQSDRALQCDPACAAGDRGEIVDDEDAHDGMAA